jgi:hypothetical protein
MTRDPGQSGGYSSAALRVCWVLALALTLVLSACGGSGGGGSSTGGGGGSRLSAGSYRMQLKTIGRESNTAQHAVERGFRATSIPQLAATLKAFGAAEGRIGDQVAALSPPANAAAANTELARGEHDTASEVNALLPKIRKMPSAQAAVAYLSKHSTSRGGREIDQALATLKRLGYIKKVS